MAVKQLLVGVCFASVTKLVNSDEGDFVVVPMNLYYQWLGYASKIQVRNRVMNEKCVEMQRMVREAGFKSYIMKGQVNALLYKVSGERLGGRDVDLSLLRQNDNIYIYLDGGHYKVMAFVNATHPIPEVNELDIALMM